jgi:hypothetical protein
MQREHRDMRFFRAWRCHICDQSVKPGQRWFALVEDRRRDTLAVFHREAVGGLEPVYSICSAVHVCELVAHWMVTGSLDYPFARPIPHRERERERECCPVPLPERSGGPLAIGELAIDREAMPRVIYENPGAVQVMLEELHEALERSVAMQAQTARAVRFHEFSIPHA